MFYFTLLNLILILTIRDTSPKSIQQITIPTGATFSFDCHNDDLVFFGRTLGEWSQVNDGDSRYSYINFLYLDEENTLRISINSPEAPHVGFYGCRDAESRSKSMRDIYQLILADVESFYWSYICHGPVGSCTRNDDPVDTTSSRLTVAEQTQVNLFCCASVTGYENVNINMNRVGQSQGRIDTKQKKDLDGSLVICANQHTTFQRKYSESQETLKCELVIDDEVQSSLTSFIEIQDPMPFDPDWDSSDDDSSNPKSNSGNGEDSDRLIPRKKFAIIFGSLVGGLVVLGLSFFLIFFLCRKMKAAKKSIEKSQTTNYTAVSVVEPSTTADEPPNTDDHAYLEPIPLNQNSIIITRL